MVFSDFDLDASAWKNTQTSSVDPSCNFLGMVLIGFMPLSRAAHPQVGETGSCSSLQGEQTHKLNWKTGEGQGANPKTAP